MKFSKYEVVHVVRVENTNVDALAQLATSKDSELLRLIPIEVIPDLSISKKEEIVAINHEPSWMDDIINYLENDQLLEDRDHVRRVKYHIEQYLMYDWILYKRGLSTLLPQ